MKIRSVLIFIAFCALGACAEGIPILDLSEGHSYSLIAEGGISATPRDPKLSQFILNTNLQVKLGSGRKFTVDLYRAGAGVFYCPPDNTNLEFILLASQFQNVEQARLKFQEIGKAFQWDAVDFANLPHLEQGFHLHWFILNENELPYYVAKVSLTKKASEASKPPYPYTIELIIAWDTNRLEKLSTDAGIIRRKSELAKAIALAESQPPIVIPKAPEDIAKLYLDLLNKKNFNQVARLLDSDGIKHFRQILSYIDHGSGSEFGDGLRKFYFGESATRESTAKLSDEEFFGKWMQGSAFITAFMGVDPNASSDVELIGSVPENQNKLHVLARMHSVDHYTGNTVSNLVLTSLRKQADGNWKVEVSDAVLNSAESNAKTISGK